MSLLILKARWPMTYAQVRLFPEKVFFKLRKLLPRRLKTLLRILWEYCHAELILVSTTYRRYFVVREVNRFRRGVGRYNNWGGKKKLNVGAFWDADGRFSWIARVAIERNIGLLHLPRSIYRPIFAHLIIRNGYSTDPTLGEVSLEKLYHEKLYDYRTSYKQYCKRVAKILKEVFDFDVILMPKLADDWIIDVIAGLKDAGLPIVVNDREWFTSPKRLEVWPKYFQAIAKDITIERLVNTNKLQQLFYERCKVPAEKMIITGRPESDYWIHSGAPPKRRQIHAKLLDGKVLMLFFAFGQRNYLNNYYQGEVRDWTSLCEDYHQVLLELLKAHENLQIAYKIGGKPARDLSPSFDQFYAEAVHARGADSVIVLSGECSAMDLVRCSDCVMGFQTSALVEAMYTNQPIFYGAWGDLFSDIKETLVPFHLWDGISFLDSKDALFEACNQFIESPSNFTISAEEERSRKSIREALNFKPDGNSSSRIMDVIQELARERE